MKYEIELPDEIKDEVGTMYEPTGEYRKPRPGDFFAANHYTSNDIEVKSCLRDNHAIARIILRPKWTWPSWLGGWGFTKGRGGYICWTSEPVVKNSNEGVWQRYGDCEIVPADALKLIYPGFIPPVITDWTKPVLNPNWNKDAK